MIELPPFTADGLLPPGEYLLTLDELRQSTLVLGLRNPNLYPEWDAAWRETLVANLAVLVRQLWTVRITEIYINGSFVEDKDYPSDIDGYFACELGRFATGDLQRQLNALDPFQIWTWDPASRRPYRGYPKRQLPMWHQYRVELYPHYGQPCGIRDEHGYELEFPSAFRRSRRDGKPKGIVKIGGHP